METARTINNLHIEYIRMEDVKPNPYQPRRVFDMIALQELSNSIKEFGVLQPICVRKLGQNAYELVSGERRLRASKMAGLETIPAVILKATDGESAVIALVENIQRQNLHFLEEAIGFSNIMDDYTLTQEELAKTLGKSQSTIANKLRLLRLSDDVKKIIVDNNLTERHARALLRIPDEKIVLRVLKRIIDSDLTVKKSEELVERELAYLTNKVASKDEEKTQRVKRHLKDVRLFTNTIKQAISVMKDAGCDVNYLYEDKDDFVEMYITIQKI